MPAEILAGVDVGCGQERKIWSSLEDDAIMELVETVGTKQWSVISDKLNLKSLGPPRTGKQCRTRCVLCLTFSMWQRSHRVLVLAQMAESFRPSYQKRPVDSSGAGNY